jgi:hypothetical protein
MDDTVKSSQNIDRKFENLLRYALEQSDLKLLRWFIHNLMVNVDELKLLVSLFTLNSYI